MMDFLAASPTSGSRNRLSTLRPGGGRGDVGHGAGRPGACQLTRRYRPASQETQTGRWPACGGHLAGHQRSALHRRHGGQVWLGQRDQLHGQLEHFVITAVSPTGTGTVDVTVTTPEGTSPISEADEFIYGPHIITVAPNRGPAGGGTSVTITGTDLAGVTAVKFGSANATSFKVNSSSSIAAVSPEGTGTVDVTAVDPEASSEITAGDQFSYVPAPTVTGVSPPGGPEAGGTEVAITGTNFTEVTAVHFGMTPVGFTVNSEGLITLDSPPGVGAVDVTVTAFGGTSLTSFADQFSYEPAPDGHGRQPRNRVVGRRRLCHHHRDEPRRSYSGPLRVGERHGTRGQLG